MDGDKKTEGVAEGIVGTGLPTGVSQTATGESTFTPHESVTNPDFLSNADRLPKDSIVTQQLERQGIQSAASPVAAAENQAASTPVSTQASEIGVPAFATNTEAGVTSVKNPITIEEAIKANAAAEAAKLAVETTTPPAQTAPITGVGAEPKFPNGRYPFGVPPRTEPEQKSTQPPGFVLKGDNPLAVPGATAGNPKAEIAMPYLRTPSTPSTGSAPK